MTFAADSKEMLYSSGAMKNGLSKKSLTPSASYSPRRSLVIPPTSVTGSSQAPFALRYLGSLHFEGERGNQTRVKVSLLSTCEENGDPVSQTCLRHVPTLLIALLKALHLSEVRLKNGMGLTDHAIKDAGRFFVFLI